MKTIKLNEQQMVLLTKLVESESAPDFEDGDIKEFGNPSEISTTATVQDDEGNRLTVSSYPEYLLENVGNPGTFITVYYDEENDKIYPTGSGLHALNGMQLAG